jgi:hypothetical protein
MITEDGDKKPESFITALGDEKPDSFITALGHGKHDLNLGECQRFVTRPGRARL